MFQCVSSTVYSHHKIRSKQGWARDVKGRDRDAHVSRPRQDPDVGFTSRD